MEQIVVGVDGSRGARAALRFAVAEAELRQACVRAVMAWHLPYYGGMAGMPLPIEPTGIEEAYRADLDSLVEEVDASSLPTPVERVLVQGTPAAVLLDHTSDAALLVVGSRGRGGFVGLLLGSVSQQVAAHAPCPVVIVPAKEEP
jgi:nucleotide-binding universal stress UspA family protein